jgi:hypothetical protein
LQQARSQLDAELEALSATSAGASADALRLLSDFLAKVSRGIVR